jgi:hypothetical protein
MSKANVHQARMAKRRLRKPGDLRSLQRMLWQALIECERVLMHAADDEMTLRAAHAVGQVGGQYSKLLEIGEFESRLAALEAALASRHPSGHVITVGRS